MSKDGKKTRDKSKKKSTITNCAVKKSRPYCKNDNIAKSKKLVQKLQSCRQKSRSSSRINNNGTRVCGNGKPMPSLSELEKMFEDSDDDKHTKIITPKKNKSLVSSSPSEILTSPRKGKKITDKMIAMISNLQDPTAIIEYPQSILPLKKRKAPEVPHIVGCEEQISKRQSSKFCKGNTCDIETIEDTDDDNDKETKRTKTVDTSKSLFSSKSNGIATWLKDCEKSDHSDGSTDSNKTVEYDLSKSPYVSSRAYSFSPLPSTSRDSETINRNDQLFNESLLSDSETKEDQSKIGIKNDLNSCSDLKLLINSKQSVTDKTINDTKIDDDVKIIQNPCETIVIDDDIEITRPEKNKNNDENYKLDCIEIVESDVKKGSVKSTKDNEAIIIDDDDYYKFVDETPPCDEITEVIDIDDIIAENKAIIEKYSKNTDKDINSVTYVDSSTISNWKNDEAPSIDPENISKSSAVDKTRKTNTISSDSGDDQNNTKNQLQTIVKNFFTTQPSHETHSEVKAPVTSEALVLQKFTEWLHILNRKNCINTHSTSRNNMHSLPLDDSVILVDDMPSPALNNPPRVPDVTMPTYCTTVTPTIHPFFKNLKRQMSSVQNDGRRYKKNHEHHICRMHRHLLMNHNSEPVNIDSGSQVNYRRRQDCNRTNIFPNTQPPDTIQRKKQPPVHRPAPVTTPIAASTTTSPVKNIGDCPICMDSLANNSVASTICGHVFCMKCIEAAIKANGKRCPTCRKTLKKGGYHQLFL